MEQKMIRLPFNLEMAKQITNGEKEGRIVTRDGKNVRILSFDRKDECRPIIALVDNGNMENVYALGIDGKEIVGNTIDLMLEVPEYTRFKDGDVIAFGRDEENPAIGILKNEEEDTPTHYDYVVLTVGGVLHFNEGGWIYNNVRIATTSEQKKLIDALKKSTDPRAKDCLKMLGIEEEKPKYEFKPFDKVLVRDENDDVWSADIFSHIDKDETYSFKCVGFSWKYCIPYEGNENLLGTTQNP